jgi:hypothetical protein
MIDYPARMHRRTALATLAAALLATLTRLLAPLLGWLEPAPAPRRLLFTTAGTAPAGGREETRVVFEGTDFHGNPVREVLVLSDWDGEEVVSAHAYTACTITMSHSSAAGDDATVAIGFGPRIA